MHRSALLAVFVAAVLSAIAVAEQVPPPAKPEIPPQPVTVTTTLPTHRDYVPQCAFDGDADLAFRSARGPWVGDTFTLTLAKPAAVKSVAVATGTERGGDAHAAVLEVSADGETWREAALVVEGAASANLGGKPVKAVRLRMTEEAEALAIREITLEADPPVPTFKYPVEIILNTSETPDMQAWAERARDLSAAWYPALCDVLASDGYKPPRRIDLVFKKSDKGIAGTAGRRIICNDGWFKAHPNDVGAVIHEVIHVVQSYPKYDPPWLVEGLDDYVRFWIFEPDTPKRRLDPNRIKVTDSYQVTGAFLAWVVEKHDKAIIRKLNAALRKGEYKPEIFKDATGKDLDALFEEFRQSLRG
jgi:hypothetical protein